MNITPEQADQWAQRATDGPWSIDPDYGTVEPDVISGEGCRFEASDEDLALIAAAPDLAQTIAGMTVEYALETLWGTGHDWAVTTGWLPTPERAWADLALDTGPTRLVRRLVSETEVIDGE